MSLIKPYHRIYRQFIIRPNTGYSSSQFILDKDYANEPHHYIRAFLIIQEDIKNLFEYIEPADKNSNTFSFRIYELLVRTCIELEANFKAILRENTYSPTTTYKGKQKLRVEKDWNINDYIKINKTHHLDNYFVELPFWRGNKNRYQPFAEWQNNKPLSWYQAYNQCKHDRNGKFEVANFQNLILAFTGLFALLSSQFHCEDFSPGSTLLSIESNNYGIGQYLKIEFPSNWQDSEKYDFNWALLKKEPIRFEKFDYNTI